MNPNRQSRCFYPSFMLHQEKDSYVYNLIDVLTALAWDICENEEPQFPFNIHVDKRESNGTVIIRCEVSKGEIVE